MGGKRLTTQATDAGNPKLEIRNPKEIPCFQLDPWQRRGLI
jgi:hypothetical protein